MAGSLLIALSNELNELTSSQYAPFSPFHTKSPFSRFFGSRHQKSENIAVSARGRRRPQAPNLRTLRCAMGQKYDYKSSVLYSRSSHFGQNSHLGHFGQPFPSQGGHAEKKSHLGWSCLNQRDGATHGGDGFRCTTTPR